MTALAAREADKTRKNRVLQDEAEAAAEKATRDFNNSSVRFNKKADKALRLDLGTHIGDTVRTDHTEVPERVTFRFKLRYEREIGIEFGVEGAENRAKPEGYEGAVIIWAVLDKPPANHAELNGGHAMASRTPHYLEFPEEQRGKTVYVSLAWQNERGIRGEYSEIKSAVIP